MKKTLIAAGMILVLLASCISVAGAETIRGLSAERYEATALGVSWNALGTDEPLYTVTCKAEGADRETERRTYKTYCTINYLSPGTTYLITVSTASGATASISVTLPVPSPYTDFNYSLLDTGVYRSTPYESDYAAVTALSAATLAQDIKAYHFSMLLKFTMNATRQNKYLDFELVLTMPGGDAYSLSDVFWYAASRTSVTEHYVFNGALRKVLNDYGTFPAGTYTLTAYIDNGIAAQTTFTVE